MVACRTARAVLLSSTRTTLLKVRIGTSVAFGARPTTVPGAVVPLDAPKPPSLTITLPVLVPWPGLPW